MNIKITKEEHEFLKRHQVTEIVIGSKLYGTEEEGSDTDFLCIYNKPSSWSDSNLPNFHQFQYDDVRNNCQYIWTTEEQFWKNQMSGDSTINSDVILFGEKYSDLAKLELCRTYKVIKGYLGFAKRDLKEYKKKNKLFHIARGLYCAEKLIYGKLPTLYDVQNRCRNIINVPVLRSKENQLRLKCNSMFNEGLLGMYYIPKVSSPLYQKLLDSNNTKEFRYL